MDKLISLCEEHFGKTNFYEVLGVEKGASIRDVRKAYHKLSKEVHPDKVSEDEKQTATVKFQIISALHAALTDPAKKEEYDTTGTFDDMGEGVEYWKRFWKEMFHLITEESIDDFMTKYLGSEEEINDLKKSYMDSEGDMDYIMNTVPGCSASDEPRFVDILKGLIEKEGLPAFEKFTNESKAKKLKRQRKNEKETELFEKIMGKKPKGDSSLMPGVGASKYKSAIDAIEAKYCTNSKPKSKAKAKKAK